MKTSCRKQPLSQPWSLIGATILTLVIASGAEAASKITAIDFQGTQDPNSLTISADGPISFTKQEIAQDNQVILEIKGAQLSKLLSRKIDTSSFKGKVALISPYQVHGEPDTVRVVIQMRESGGIDVAQMGNSIKATIPLKGNPAESEFSPSTAAAPAPPSAPEGGASSSSSPNGGSSSSVPADNGSQTAASEPEPQLVDVSRSNAPVAAASKTSSGPRSRLEGFMDSRTTKNFVGKPITLQVKGAEVVDVFRLISEASGFNIVLGDDVKGKLSLSLVDVPWDQALDMILHTLKLGAERTNNILRVVTLQNLTAEKQEELKAVQAAQAAAPRITRIFSISYANLTDMQTLLKQFSSGGATAGASATAGGTPLSMVQIDSRTNSIIVQDTPENVEKIRRLIEILDTQPPQVMIEAKVIEATEQFSKTLNGTLGMNTARTIQFGFNTAASLNTGGSLGNSGGSPSQASNNSNLIFNPPISFLPGGSLTAALALGESEAKLRVVASPKTVVLNRESAKIIQSTPVLVPKTVTNPATGVVSFVVEQQPARLSLEVKPTITNEGGVLLDLKVQRDIPFPIDSNNTGIAERQMNTLVLVESGTTLVMGGVYTSSTTSTEQGFPTLRKIPLLGWLFGGSFDRQERSELFFFITPRILNAKEAGISG